MNETARQILTHIHENPDEYVAYGGLADAMREQKVPGANIVQAAGEHARTYGGPHGWAGVPDSARARRLIETYYGRPAHHGLLSAGHGSVGVLARNDVQPVGDDVLAEMPRTLVYRHLPMQPSAGAHSHMVFAEAHPANVAGLVSDLPPEHAARITRAVERSHQ